MTDVIIAATATRDRVAPMLAIANDLLDRGHSVTVLTGSRFRNTVVEMGARFAPLTGDADMDPHLFDSPDRASLEELDKLNWDLQHSTVAAMGEQWRSLQELLSGPDGDETVVVSDSRFWGIAPGLAGAPGFQPRRHVVIGVDALAVSSRDLAPFGSGAAPATTVGVRERYAEATAYSRDVLFASTQVLFVSAMRSAGVIGEVPFFFDCLAILAETYLQLSIPELSYVRSDLPNAVAFVGALPAPTGRPEAMPVWWDDVLAAETVVVVTQGTVYNDDLGELILPTLQALADEPVLVVAITGDPHTSADLPANARAAAFIPFAELLPHADVLVSNGDYDGMQQALALGVPLVLAGDEEDRIEWNARAARTGAAINLQTQRPAVDDIHAAVMCVLEQEKFRLATAALADAYRATRPYDSISQAVQGRSVR
jgi:UDP:flavonoid glycosyltransferase YjiC (YdhE family)